MSKKSSDPLTRGFENGPVALTIWATTREAGRIISRPHVVNGPVFQFVSGGHTVPPEWLERCIPIADDEEDASCR